MADEEHVKRLRQGVSAWNKWRNDNLGAGLTNADLISADLSGADLSDSYTGK